jgi:hypothetical protein
MLLEEKRGEIDSNSKRLVKVNSIELTADEPSDLLGALVLPEFEVGLSFCSGLD